MPIRLSYEGKSLRRYLNNCFGVKGLQEDQHFAGKYMEEKSSKPEAK